MKVTKANEGVEYSPPGHFGVNCVRLQDPDASGGEHLVLSISRFEPGGGCEFSAVPDDAPINMLYYIVEGEMSVTVPDGSFVLKAGDSVEWLPGDGRSIRNETDKMTTMLVIIGK